MRECGVSATGGAVLQGKPASPTACNGHWVGDWANPLYHVDGWAPCQEDVYSRCPGHDGGQRCRGVSVMRAVGA